MNQIEQGIDTSLIQVYKWFVLKEKTIYTSLNKLEQSGSYIRAEFWCPDKYKERLDVSLSEIQRANNLDRPVLDPAKKHDGLAEPSFFEDNEFTFAFSEIVNTYGIPNYKEINPAVFTCATFPFLFGFMFGDIMHGIMLTIFGIVCIINAEKWRNTGLRGFVIARYLLLLMGIFATFAGFCYNDMTSIPLKIFGESCYDIGADGTTATLREGCVYPIGIDPSWYRAANELTFMNSLKMKMSVIFGVMQMSMGVFIKALNAIYFGHKIEFFFEFIPQIVLLLSLFGFMDLMIVAKWLIDWENYPNGEGRPPSIVTQMIDMLLKGGSLSGSPLIPNMEGVMKILLLCAMCALPFMLFVRPCYEGFAQAKRAKLRKRYADYVQVHEENQKNFAINTDMDPEEARGGLDPMPEELAKKEHPMSDVVVH
eukprot:scpid52081/ scgid16847/ Vacuolar proton translocating ATPase 100 kDa subunit; Clathrin-coated vesicle/synaptic vesicle proton pump 100 kDa subunit; Vacuolar ATPase transmembrane subunit